MKNPFKRLFDMVKSIDELCAQLCRLEFLDGSTASATQSDALIVYAKDLKAVKLCSHEKDVGHLLLIAAKEFDHPNPFGIKFLDSTGADITKEIHTAYYQANNL